MKLGMVDYVWDPTPHDNSGGGSSTWVVWDPTSHDNSGGGSSTWVVWAQCTCHISEFLFFLNFFFLFLLSSPRAQVAFLD